MVLCGASASASSLWRADSVVCSAGFYMALSIPSISNHSNPILTPTLDVTHETVSIIQVLRFGVAVALAVAGAMFASCAATASATTVAAALALAMSALVATLLAMRLQWRLQAK